MLQYWLDMDTLCPLRVIYLIWLKQTLVRLPSLGWCESCQTNPGADQTTGIRPLENDGLCFQADSGVISLYRPQIL